MVSFIYSLSMFRNYGTSLSTEYTERWAWAHLFQYNEPHFVADLTSGTNRFSQFMYTVDSAFKHSPQANIGHNLDCLECEIQLSKYSLDFKHRCITQRKSDINILNFKAFDVPHESNSVNLTDLTLNLYPCVVGSIPNSRSQHHV